MVKYFPVYFLFWNLKFSGKGNLKFSGKEPLIVGAGTTQQIPEQKIYWKIFYHKFTDQVDHKFMENLTKNI